MAKTLPITEVIYNGRQAMEVFGLSSGYKLWMEKNNYTSLEKTRSDWEKFFKDSKVI